jgi:hypothetical protein
MEQEEQFADEEMPVKKSDRGRKPSKASRLKTLEREILQQTLIVKQEKLKYQQLVTEYNTFVTHE